MFRSARRIWILFLVAALKAHSFQFSGIAQRRRIAAEGPLFYEKGGDSMDDFDTETLNERLYELRVHIFEEEYRRPPNPSFSPQEFITEVLKALWNNSDPLPDSGFRTLLRASTPEWRRTLYNSIGAPNSAPEEAVVSAFGEAMARPHNQFAILTGEDERYYITFPTDVLDYADGTCWVECRLRNVEDDSLLAVLGWELEQRPSDKAWLVARIDWQDFRGTCGCCSRAEWAKALSRSIVLTLSPCRRVSAWHWTGRVDAYLWLGDKTPSYSWTIVSNL